MNEWHQAEFHAQRAHRFYEAGEWDKALAELRLALAFDPAQPDWHFGMGLTLEALHRFDEAAASFEQVLRLRDPDSDVLIHLAVSLIRADQCRRAIETLEKAAALEPDLEPAYCHRILAHALLGEHEKAEEAFYMARQLVDDCPLCLDHMAQSQAMRGNLDRAAWCWEQTLRLNPHHPSAHGNLARVHWQKNSPDRATQEFTLQLREDPGDIDSLLQYGVLLGQLSRHAEAGEKFRRVLELEPTNAQAHYHLGELALIGGHIDAAVAELEMADRLDPTLPGVQLALAQAAVRRQRHDAARTHLRSELDREGRTNSQSLEAARLLIELRQPQPALDVLNSLLGAPGEPPMLPPLEPTQRAAALLCRGVANMLLGNVEHGIGDCRQSLRLAPDTVLTLENLALAYLSQGRLARARVMMRRASELNADDNFIRQLRVRVLRARAHHAFRKLLTFRR